MFAIYPSYQPFHDSFLGLRIKKGGKGGFPSPEARSENELLSAVVHHILVGVVADLHGFDVLPLGFEGLHRQRVFLGPFHQSSGAYFLNFSMSDSFRRMISQPLARYLGIASRFAFW